MAAQTINQRKAHDRSFYIFRLRGLWSAAGLIRNQTYVEQIRAIIDTELAAQNAETGKARYERLQALRRKAWDGDEAAMDELEKASTTNWTKRKRFNVVER